MAFEEGPYVQAACFCESVIEDKSGTLSLIRIIDTLTHTEANPDPPSAMPAIPFKLQLVVMLKAGKARGRFDLQVKPELPNGSSKDPFTMSIHLEGEEKGQNVVANLAFTFEMEGLYWFNVYLDDERLTRIPFRVKYNRIVIRQSSQTA